MDLHEFLVPLGPDPGVCGRGLHSSGFGPDGKAPSKQTLHAQGAR